MWLNLLPACLSACLPAGLCACLPAIIESPCLGKCMHSDSIIILCLPVRLRRPDLPPSPHGSRDDDPVHGQASQGGGAARARRGESFLRVHWVAVPEALRARRVNRRRRRRRAMVTMGRAWPAPSSRSRSVRWIARSSRYRASRHHAALDLKNSGLAEIRLTFTLDIYDAWGRCRAPWQRNGDWNQR
jgi:hypothetical protein